MAVGKGSMARASKAAAGKKADVKAAVVASVEEKVVEAVEFQDETLVCKECGNEFVFTAGEQAFYKEKGFVNKPKACKACRYAKKNAQREPREYFTVTCSECGGEAKVTFQPSEDRPVYCSECFAKRRQGRD